MKDGEKQNVFSVKQFDHIRSIRGNKENRDLAFPMK